MILADEADVLEEAFFRADVSDVSELEYQEQDFEDYAEFLQIERDIIPDIRPYFSVTEELRCKKHRIPISSCGCDDLREAEVLIYRLDTESLVEDWVETVRDRDIFDSIEWEKITPTRFVLTTWIDRTKITFYCFFDRERLEKQDLEPQALEFGVSFFGDQQAVERDYRYSWREVLSDDFREQLTVDIKHLKEAIGADFYEYDTLEGFRDRVRQSLRDYFSDSGYAVRREVGEVCAVETTQYNIDTGKTDFVGYDDESKFVVCHCEKTPGWHIHHFTEGRIESAEQTPIIEDMTKKIESKINTYQDIRTNKQTASRFVTVIATFFSIGFVVLLFDRLGSISTILREQFQLGGSLELIGIILLVLDGIAAAVLAAVITRPYFRDFRFNWDIKPFGRDDLRQKADD